MATLALIPLKLNLYLYDNDGHTIVFELVDDVDAAVDVSGYTWAAQWRPSRSSSTSVSLTVDSSSAASGVVSVTFTPANMTSIAGAVGQWDVQGTLAGVPLTIVEGKVTVNADVTRP